MSDIESRLLELEAHKEEALARLRRIDITLERHQKLFMGLQQENQSRHKALIDRLDAIILHIAKEK